jgi:hypothetical protein
VGLSNSLLADSPRLVQAASGPPSVKHAPPKDDPDAVGRIQIALRLLPPHPKMPKTFTLGDNPDGGIGVPDGQFGEETVAAVIAYQKRVFPNSPKEWDGRVGVKTLAAMDRELPPNADNDLKKRRIDPPPKPNIDPNVNPLPKPLPKPSPIPAGIEVIGQINPLVLLHVDDDESNDDLDSDMRDLKDPKNTRLARIRVWFAKIGAGARSLDLAEKFVAGGFLLPLPVILGKLVEDGIIEAAALLDVTAAAIKNFPNLDTTVRMSPRATNANTNLMQNELAAALGSGMAVYDKFKAENTPKARREVIPLAQNVARSSAFQAAAQTFEDSMRKNVSAQAVLGQIHFGDLQTTPQGRRAPNATPGPVETGQATNRSLPTVFAKTPAFSIRKDPIAKICIGGLQGIDVTMTRFSANAADREWSATLMYELLDHFGANDDDVEIDSSLHGSPGQIALWTLQHFAASGHKPFRPILRIERAVAGSF